MRFLIVLLAVSAFAQTLIRPIQIKGGAVTPNAVCNEQVAGGGLTYTLRTLPVAGTLRLWRNGMRAQPGSYVLNGRVVTFLFAHQPERGDGLGLVIADYERTSF